VNELVNWFTDHAYLLVFVTVALELVGVPFPSETILLGAGAAAASGDLNVLAVMAVAAVAAVLGAFGGYGIGRIGGRPLLDRLVSRGWPRQQQVLRVEQFFERHGGKSLVGSRFVPFVRIFAPWMAGAAQMPVPQFVAWNVVGAVAWVAVVTTAGFVFGASVEAIANSAGVLVAVVAVIAVAGAFVWHRVRSHG
jgi:membrane protein DedA with SNARE-associated domain